MTSTEIWRDFDPNLDIPLDLKNVRVSIRPDVVNDAPVPDADIDVQEDTLEDDESQLDDDETDDDLGVPGSYAIVSQTVRTAPDGSQVVDVVIDVEDIEGASKYDVRITK